MLLNGHSQDLKINDPSEEDGKELFWVRMRLLEIAVEILWRGNSLAIVRAHLININTRNTKVQKLRNAKIQHDPSDVGIAVEILRRGNSLAIVRTHYNKPRQSITPAIPAATPAQHFPQWTKVCKFWLSKISKHVLTILSFLHLVDAVLVEDDCRPEIYVP